MTELVGIVARALRKAGFRSDERDAADIVDALRDPPPAVIEAGAKAMKNELRDHFTVNEWEELADPIREWWKARWLASWRAALDARETKT